jgi:hypothetical protein
MEGQTGDNFALRVENSPLGDNFAPGWKFSPRVEVKNGPLDHSEMSVEYQANIFLGFKSDQDWIYNNQHIFQQSLAKLVES